MTKKINKKETTASLKKRISKLEKNFSDLEKFTLDIFYAAVEDRERIVKALPFLSLPNSKERVAWFRLAPLIRKPAYGRFFFYIDQWFYPHQKHTNRKRYLSCYLI